MNKIENEIFLGITISFEKEFIQVKGILNENIKELPEIEVIGNIYEHPHLLTSEQQKEK